MSLSLFAQPYDLSAQGFCFESAEEFTDKARSLRNALGLPVEEFEIQFIDGSAIDAELAEALAPSQATLNAFFTYVEEWDDHEKQTIIIAVGECGYAFDWERSEPSDFDVDVYLDLSLRELAEQFVEDGLFGEVPEQLRFYLDFDAIARDLGMDYVETEIAGQRLTYRCS